MGHIGVKLRFEWDQKIQHKKKFLIFCTYDAKK